MTFEPVPLHDSLDLVVRSLRGDATSARSMGSLFSRWAEAVGDKVAQHARPIKLENGHLVIEVDEPGWATELRFLEQNILERLRAVADLQVTRFDVRVKRP